MGTSSGSVAVYQEVELQYRFSCGADCGVLGLAGRSKLVRLWHGDCSTK